MKPKGGGTRQTQGVSFCVNSNHRLKLGDAMFRRSADAREAQSGLSSNSLDRPLPVNVVGLAFLISAAQLLLGGAYREQANMISTGLLFLSLGAVFAPSVIRKSRILLVAFCALAILGLYYALTT